MGLPFGVATDPVRPAYARRPLAWGQVADRARNLGISEAEVIEKAMLEPAAIKWPVEREGVARLVSDAARPITGASVPISLGWTAR